jgi:dTDP-4-dehydrorhamnose 3,5-epimerase
MIITPTNFNGLYILEPKVIGDARGYFMETYNFNVLNAQGIGYKFIQDNQSKSGKGVLRGLHYQNAPYAQTKLVRVLAGTILDIVIDLRKGESTFGKTFVAELSGDNKKQLLIPKGFGHGFAVLSETAEVLYKCDEFYGSGTGDYITITKG